MVTHPITVDIKIILFLTRHLFNHLKAFENRTGISLSSPQVVSFPAPWLPVKLIHQTRNILRVDIVTNLFPLIAINVVLFPLDIAADQIAQEAMKLDTS